MCLKPALRTRLCPMGCGSRGGKMEQHNSGKPSVDQDTCVGCRTCAKNCAHGAISFNEQRKASIDHSKCVGCGRCLGACNFDAIYNENSSANDDLNKKIAEYSKAVVDGRPAFHISLVMDVSPYCDCHAENDAPIIPDVGMHRKAVKRRCGTQHLKNWYSNIKGWYILCVIR